MIDGDDELEPEPVTEPEPPSTTEVTEPLDDALADPSLPRVPGTTA